MPLPSQQHTPTSEALFFERPFLGQTFDLVFCDGQVLRTHSRGEHREHGEPFRLRVSQLILALQRIDAGGTLPLIPDRHLSR